MSDGLLRVLTLIAALGSGLMTPWACGRLRCGQGARWLVKQTEPSLWFKELRRLVPTD